MLHVHMIISSQHFHYCQHSLEARKLRIEAVETQILTISIITICSSSGFQFGSFPSLFQSCQNLQQDFLHAEGVFTELVFFHTSKVLKMLTTFIQKCLVFFVNMLLSEPYKQHPWLQPTLGKKACSTIQNIWCSSLTNYAIQNQYFNLLYGWGLWDAFLGALRGASYAQGETQTNSLRANKSLGFLLLGF